MELLPPASLVFLLLAFSSGCNPSANTSSSSSSNGPAFDINEIQQDIKTGRLKFEIRGLTNEVQDKSYGGKSYTHSAVVIPVGDSKYTKASYLLMLSTKRLSGGDSENTRKDDDVTPVYIHDGMGRFAESGGYKSKDEKWEPERIQVRPEVVFVGIPVVGTPVQE